MKRRPTAIACLWALVFLSGAVWLNNVPRKVGMFNQPILLGPVEYGFPAPIGRIDFERDPAVDGPFSRFLHRNFGRYHFENLRNAIINLAIMFVMTFIGCGGATVISRESRVAAALLCGIWIVVVAIVVGYIVWIARSGLDPHFELLDEIATGLCVVWLAFSIVTFKHFVESIIQTPLRNDRHFD